MITPNSRPQLSLGYLYMLYGALTMCKTRQIVGSSNPGTTLGDGHQFNNPDVTASKATRNSNVVLTTPEA